MPLYVRSLTAAGRRLSVEIRATGGDELGEKSALAMADAWQRIGGATDPFIIPEQRQRDREFRSTFPAFDVRQTRQAAFSAFTARGPRYPRTGSWARIIRVI